MWAVVADLRCQDRPSSPLLLLHLCKISPNAGMVINKVMGGRLESEQGRQEERESSLEATEGPWADREAMMQPTSCHYSHFRGI